MFFEVSGGCPTSWYLLLNFKWKASGKWILTAYDAFLARRRTQAAGDIVQYLMSDFRVTLQSAPFKF